MSKRTDTEEAIEFQGTVTVVASTNPVEYGGGNIEVEGVVFTDIILENTDNLGVDLEGTNFNDNSFTLTDISSPTVPPLGSSRFYTDSSDTLLKSKDNNDIVTVYQPTNTKGDLLTHNGTTQVRLPVGTNGQILIADSSVSQGVKWSDNTVKISKFPIIGVDKSTFVIPYYYGSYFMNVYPFIKKGSSSMFLLSKSKANRYGHINRFVSNPSILSYKILKSNWVPFKEVELYKDYTEDDGDYFIGNNSEYEKNIVTLTSTSWTSLGTIYNFNTGVFCISIFSDNEGPAATFLIGKTTQALNSPAIQRISSSPASSNTKIRLRWQASSGIEISKSNNNNNGDYNIIDNFQNSSSLSITLTGTSVITIPQSFFRFYENKTFITRIYSNITDAPMIIAMISKNDHTRSGNKFILNIPGSGTSEKIILKWDSNSLLTINKTGINYDGNYNLDIIQFQ